ncbi:MAG TPA: hypothetical protein DCY48_00550 [Candidatus Magasanikbacteria bacterium]|nr:MAG: hypothetical protein A3C10_00850 [Candidatus Magasanikbacteria bacterium RIFCSPHIGHO2_02_FULL_48_18]OGH82030.1 MAG: hypothetical protein A3G08_02360 [Candidatus Magasanikbacteria bacterium RIFCSPLOWO2_12_FULL_47_9b]HAZ28253.1 hypothetical protein [Candidatus Magasanikbacteria bacterium]
MDDSFGHENPPFFSAKTNQKRAFFAPRSDERSYNDETKKSRQACRQHINTLSGKILWFCIYYSGTVNYCMATAKNQPFRDGFLISLAFCL